MGEVLKNEILEEFYKSEWFLERPDYIKELFRKYPITEEYFLRIENSNDCYGVALIGFNESEDDDEITALIINDGNSPPITQRKVFGIKIDELLSFDQIKDLNIVWHTNIDL